MIIKEYNRVNRIPYIRITSDQADTYVRIAGTDDEPTNEIMIEGTDTMLQFEEVYIPPILIHCNGPTISSPVRCGA